ncbi:hypothetical protein BURCENBC7_AP1458 [Burkholderia cenocepacia BC7]|nr:hypothetical protein BURCENK562V_C7518 [Burkholderia cenocepacia K56-2Valvano]ERI27152.1 hypothetical protein BURCENBC7_AP1458 [Burkholderia cenocepacia BC7]
MRAHPSPRRLITIRQFIGSLDDAPSVSFTDSSDQSTNGGIQQ